jgi:tetratricopeptide (TPR) repeat protein
MYEEAERELTRAEKVGATADALSPAREKLRQLRSGVEAEAPTANAEPGSPTSGGPVVFSGANPSVAKILQGDKLWNEGKPDEAAEAYRESVKLDPAEWRAWERLAIVSASMSLFAESRKALQELKTAQPDPPQQILENRYEMLRKAFDTHFNTLLGHYDTSARKFASGGMSREAYYSDANGLALRLESMAKFLDAIEVPPAKKPANTRRSLACGLMAQASSSLTDYLETNSASAKENAVVFAAAARKEMQEATKLDSNTVVITK